MITHVLLGALAGALVTAVAMWLLVHRPRRSETRTTWGRMSPAAGASSAPLPIGATDVLTVLSSTVIVVDRSDVVIQSSPSASAYGLVRRSGLIHEDIRNLVRQVRDDHVIREQVLHVSRGWTDQGPGVGADRLVLSVRVAPLGQRHILILIQDRTHEQRLEEVRRDFVANVSHELKTPVGGLSLLAEAVLDAKDDPVAVERFASRMQAEARRLSKLVTDVVDLTRLQVADVLHEPLEVDIGAVVREAVDNSTVLAEGNDIALDTVIAPGLRTFGDEDLLVTAVRNLVTNAINYSGPGTRVAVRARERDGTIEIVVADHGIGIPPEEQDRIFERFYRVDPARSRATGGTGLGLSIVKHICATHGGSVSVWSQEGKGSTFTIRLPSGVEPEDDRPESPPTTAPLPSPHDARQGVTNP